jgi:hypothetical protein
LSRWGRGLLAGIIGLALTGSGTWTSPARADAPVDQGWWTSTTPAGLPVSGVTPPDVPAQGLLVQGGPGATTGNGDTGATAYAALVFGLAPGATVGNLTLTTAPSSLSTPGAVLELCRLTDSAFSSAQGGPISDAPPYDCSQNVTAPESTSDSSFTFAVGQLESGHQLAVAVLPTNPLERVVLAAPGENALTETSAGPAPPAQTTPTPTTLGSTLTPTPAPASAPDGATPPSNPVSVVPAVSSSPVSDQAASPVVAPLRSPSTQGSSGPAPAAPAAVAFLPASATGSSGANPAAVIILITLIVLGVTAWLLAGRQATAGPRSGDPEPIA